MLGACIVRLKGPKLCIRHWKNFMGKKGSWRGSLRRLSLKDVMTGLSTRMNMLFSTCVEWRRISCTLISGASVRCSAMFPVRYSVMCFLQGHHIVFFSSSCRQKYRNEGFCTWSNYWLHMKQHVVGCVVVPHTVFWSSLFSWWNFQLFLDYLPLDNFVSSSRHVFRSV